MMTMRRKDNMKKDEKSKLVFDFLWKKRKSKPWDERLAFLLRQIIIYLCGFDLKSLLLPEQMEVSPLTMGAYCWVIEQWIPCFHWKTTSHQAL